MKRALIVVALVVVSCGVADWRPTTKRIAPIFAEVAVVPTPTRTPDALYCPQAAEYWAETVERCYFLCEQECPEESQTDEPAPGCPFQSADVLVCFTHCPDICIAGCEGETKHLCPGLATDFCEPACGVEDMP